MSRFRRFSGYRHPHFKALNTQRIETWLGAEKVAELRQNMRGWYGSPINIVDMPGSVWIDHDGDFVGEFARGHFFSALDALEHWLDQLANASKQPRFATLDVGFTSISDALSRASQGFSQRRAFSKVGPTGVIAGTSTLWRVGAQPLAGAAGAAAPGGTAHSSTDTGALGFANPAAGSLRLVGADVGSGQNGSSLLLYDRLFSVAKTMNSTAAEAVTGVPSRYQNTAPTAATEDYIGDNFLFIEVGGTALPATAHTWTACTYTDQNNTSQTLADVVGNASAIVDRLDQPGGTWFCPLGASNGIKAVTNIQCSAAVATGAINFVIGHPLGFMAFQSNNLILPFDWLTNRDQAPRIQNNACCAFLEPTKSAAASATYTGRIYTTSTSS